MEPEERQAALLRASKSCEEGQPLGAVVTLRCDSAGEIGKSSVLVFLYAGDPAYWWSPKRNPRTRSGRSSFPGPSRARNTVVWRVASTSWFPSLWEDVDCQH